MKIQNQTILFVLFFCSFLPTFAIADEGLIFGDNSIGKIEAAFLDGSNRHNFVLNTRNIVALAVDRINGKFFWSENPGSAARIKSANLDGTNVVTVATAQSGNDFIYGIALDSASHKIYWTEYYSSLVRMVNYDGTDLTTLISSGVDGPVGIDIDVSEGLLYVAEADSNEISSADFDGTNLNVVYSGTPSGPLHLYLDKTVSPKQLYYSLFTSINKIDIDGSSPSTILDSGLSIVSALSIDFQTRKAYIGDVGHHKIFSVDLDGNNFSTVLTSTMSVFGISLAEVTAPTPTPAATATPTATSTPTIIATASPVITQNPTPTALVTPIVTAAPTSMPQPSVVPTVDVGTGNITGTLLSTNGSPISNVLITLSGISTNSNYLKATSNDRLIKTTLTDVFGKYRFSNLPPGQFVIEPKLDGLIFDPPSLTVTSGNQAPLSYAGETEEPDARCTTKNVVKDLVNFGRSTEAILTALNRGIDHVSKVLQKGNSTQSKIRLLSKLARIQNDSEIAYLSTLQLSAALPLVVKNCPRNIECKIRRYSNVLNRLRGKLRQIIRHAEQIPKLAKKSSSNISRASISTIQKVYKRYTEAVRITGYLPSHSMSCLN